MLKSQVKLTFDKDNNSNITITEGIYKDIQFRYGKVWFENPDSEQPTMQFQYDILGEVHPDAEAKQDFEHQIAELLHALLLEQLEAGEVQYTGGEAPPDYKIEDYIPPKKNAAQQIMQAPGVFTSKKSESAMSFLDRLAAQGMAAMRKP